MTDEELRELLGTEPVREHAVPEAAPPVSVPPLPVQQEEAAAVPERPVSQEAAEQPGLPVSQNIPQPAPEAAPGMLLTAGAETEAEEPLREPRYIWLKILTVLVVLMFLAFSVLCIVRDIQGGTTSGGGYVAGNVVHVELTQHDKPKTDETKTDENGRYSYAGIAETVMPSIVEIYTYSEGSLAGSGSGIILTQDGYIATNSHVVNGASSLSVKLFDSDQDDKSYPAQIIGHDSKTDLAVIKIALTGLKPATLGDSDQVQLGEAVCALGNPAGLSGSITTGIISGMNRKVRASSSNYEMDCLQTDAAISPGNSGGALVNLYGQVIGITSSKYSASFLTGGAYEGLGFAITINEAMPILKELMEKGYISGRVRVGISFLDHKSAMQQAETDGITLPDAVKDHGILVMNIDEDSDLNNTPIKVGDWILTMNGKEITDYDDVKAALNGAAAGDRVHCRCGRVQEDGTLKTFEIDFRLLEDQSGDY
ncbi:MAG: trypsin-like peptidase domain-containing protein [Oscillospiraceae bacterium]|nr:trypsin-like peptidase domain-containing protein [Oscillospiraceae bacterium]